MSESSSIIDASKVRVQLLNVENDYIWSNKLELILRGKSLLEIVTGDEKPPFTDSVSETTASEQGEPVASTTDPTVAKKYQQRKDTALTTFLLTNEDTCFSDVIGDREPKEVWDKLKAMYISSSEANVDAYLSRYQSIYMETSETIMSYVSKLRELENKLAEIGNPVSEKEKRRALLRGAREELKLSVEVIRATDKTLAESISLLVVQEGKAEKKENNNKSHDSAFITYKKERTCYYCNKKGHYKNECYHNPQSSKFRGNHKRNWNNKISNNNNHGNNNNQHGINNYQFRKNNYQHGNNYQQGNNNNSHSNKKEEDINSYLSFVAHSLSTKSGNHSNNLHHKWFIDSGASVGMCYNANYFSNINRNHTQNVVSVGDGKTAAVEGMGNIICTVLNNGKLNQSN